MGLSELHIQHFEASSPKNSVPWAQAGERDNRQPPAPRANSLRNVASALRNAQSVASVSIIMASKSAPRTASVHAACVRRSVRARAVERIPTF